MRTSSSIKTRLPCVLVSSITLAGTFITGAWAAESEGVSTGQPASAASSTELEEIMVTARRREERLQDVPVSVSMLSATALQEQRVLTETDLQGVTPGLLVRETSSSSQTNFSIRGQSLDAFSFASPAVLPYFNEFNAVGVSGSSFFDLDSIQVLKGPQGTLFGRNATGGAVLLQSHKPDIGDTNGYVRASYGNYDDRLIEGALNLPIADVAAFRLSAQSEQRDGYQNNILLNVKQASVDNLAVRAGLRLQLDNGFDNVLTAQYGRYRGNSAGTRLYSAYAAGQTQPGGVLTLDPAIPSAVLYGSNPSVRNQRIPALGITGLFQFQQFLKTRDFYDIYNNQDARHRAQQRLVTNVTNWGDSDALHFKNVVGYNRVVSRDRTDIDGTPYVPLDIGFVGTNDSEGYTYIDEQVSEEFQVSGNVSPSLNYLVGLYGLYAYSAQNIPLSVAPDLTSGPLSVFRRTYDTRNNSYAVYAQSTYGFTDKLHLTVGGRWTREEGKFNPHAGDANAASGVTAAKRVDSKPSWTVSLDYKLSPDLMIYATQRGSWRTGGFNGTAADFNSDGTLKGVNQFEPETTYDFEVGSKYSGNIADIPIRANIALYDQTVKNVIRAIYIGVSAVSGNVKEARISGVEFDGSINPVQWLQVGISGAYTNARYTDPQGSVVGATFSFGPFADAPLWSGSAYVRTESRLPIGRLVMRGDMYAQSSFYYTNAADTILPDTKLPSYRLLNARVELNEIAGSKVSTSAYIKNITQEHYYTGGFGLGAVIGINSALPGVPRMFGFEVSTQF